MDPPNEPGAPPPGRPRGLLGLLLPASSALDLRVVGRTLIHAAVVGAVAGAVGAAFFAAVEYGSAFVLEYLCGYVPLRAHGETFVHLDKAPVFRWWLLLFIPGVGALLGGILTARYAPECQGGGGDAMIDAFHRQGGLIRRRVAWVKAAASVLTLGTGGSGGREGPTMQIGGAIGSMVARTLGVGVRERRILLIAGVAAGMAAVFRTPLGAALLAVEVLYRDDFESDALIPAVLASVTSYAVVISVFGESTLFAHAARYPFVPAHLPYYGLLALFIAVIATFFLWSMRGVQAAAARLPVPAWARPGVGGLALGLLATPVIYYVSHRIGQPGQGLGLFGGGYGAAQAAVTGIDWLPGGWAGAQLLMVLAFAKIATSTLTIGSGGSAGDFAPSLVIGGLAGGAFGYGLQALTGDPRIDPGAFALVGMGTFYGGIAHVPLSSAIMVCELAGSYDLLVPLMLAEGIAFVALRQRSLYRAQVPAKKDSPAHRDAMVLDVLQTVRVRDVVTPRPFDSFEPRTPASEMMRKVSETTWQDVFPVVDVHGMMHGIVSADALRVLAVEREGVPFAIAADVMQRAVWVRMDDSLRAASDLMLKSGVRELPVLDESGRIAAFLDESDVAKVYLERTRPERHATAPPV